MDAVSSEDDPSGVHPRRGWTQRVGALVGLPALIKELGHDPIAILQEVGLDPSALAHRDNRIPYSSLALLLARGAEKTKFEHFGLLTGRMWGFRDLGIAGELARNAPSLGHALELFTMYQRLNSEGGLAYVLRRGKYVDFGYAGYGGSTTGMAQLSDAILAIGMNIVSELAGPSWKPYEVLMPRVRPRDIDQYRAFFKVVPTFDAEVCALRFPASDMEQPVAGADAERYQRAVTLAQQAPSPDFLQRVYRSLRLLILEGRHSGDDLAQMLAMHRRTLNRRLLAHGTSFQRVLDELRYEIARQLLSNSRIPLDDVAATLGYAGVTPFMRTFRRWSGMTPGQWRRTGGNTVAQRASNAQAR